MSRHNLLRAIVDAVRADLACTSGKADRGGVDQDVRRPESCSPQTHGDNPSRPFVREAEEFRDLAARSGFRFATPGKLHPRPGTRPRSPAPSAAGARMTTFFPADRSSPERLQRSPLPSRVSRRRGLIPAAKMQSTAPISDAD